jgi:hypothetical protein
MELTDYSEQQAAQQFILTIQPEPPAWMTGGVWRAAVYRPVS